MEKIILGLTEKIVIYGHDGEHAVTGKIDTGASKSSIDLNLALNLKLGPVIESRIVKSAHGNKLRPIIDADILLGGKRVRAKFTLADRGHMRYKVLIGENILRGGYLIDPSLRKSKGESQ
ncbi:MAG TPA: RimK/LysX family protein [Candidatus Nanoarchaeia archaeon]|nr:RimK/LysX family protein [Candidatus Nanoarchaeia archaeon]